MEPMDGEQGLESERSTLPSSEGQSTDVNADNPWEFPLPTNPEENREETPKVVVKFKTKVQLHGLKLQGNADEPQEVQIILSVWDETTSTFKDVTDSSNKQLVS